MADNLSGAYKHRVLVVDDEKRIRDGCHKMLTGEGFDVARADTGDVGLKMIAEEHFDIILLDLMMPGISGFDVLEEVKTMHPDTVIIVITGYATLEHSIEAMKKGAFDFIPKPFSPKELRLVISKALEHIRTLHDIAHEKSRMRVLINHLTGGVLATDAEKKVALANPAFLNLIGYHGEDVTGKAAFDIIPCKELKDMIDQALNMPMDEFAELTTELEFKEKVLGVRCVPFRDRIGRILGAIAVLHDITTAKRVEQHKSDFVSMVSHEIRGPLNSVLMQLKVVLDGLAGDVTEKQAEILSRSSERIKALVALSTELLDLARIESGLITQEKERVDMTAILEEQVAFNRPKAEAKQISLGLIPATNLPQILANPQNMEEVVSNLISNAIRYTPEGGKISVDSGVEDNYFYFTVSDNGYGIPEDEIDLIFKRFYRVKNEKTRYITGTGLGLPIVKSIVEAHHGAIKVISELDKGTQFTVYIPIINS